MPYDRFRSASLTAPNLRTHLVAGAAALLALAATATGVAQQPVEAADATPGQVVEVTYEERLSAEQVQAAAAASFGRYGPPETENAVDVYGLRFATTGLDGGTVVVPATLFVPVEPSRERAPLYVFGSGTTGLADVCAPSREADLPAPLGDYRGYLAPYAARGIVTVFPDYLGFEDPDRPQAYFHAASEAHVLLDAARAVRTTFEEAIWMGTLEEAVVTGGYSQGGHAAFAAADRVADYAPEVPLAGAIGYAATTDVEALFREGPYYAPYVLAAWSSVYGVDRVRPKTVLAERWLPSLQREAVQVCVDRAQQVYPFDVDAMFDAAFADSLRRGTLDATHPELHALFRENRTGLSGHGLPALVVQGGNDVIVHDATQERFVQALCGLGSDVRYLNDPVARHRDTRPAGFEAAVGWIHDRAAGVPAPSTCGE